LLRTAASKARAALATGGCAPLRSPVRAGYPIFETREMSRAGEKIRPTFPARWPCPDPVFLELGGASPSGPLKTEEVPIRRNLDRNRENSSHANDRRAILARILLPVIFSLLWL